ncbi:MAG: FAD/NAD(P)-binding oxidoreductase [Campylobacterota bacterium]|nr:FAD/NAD(P)-binding oxidoreductase [Campylobacterota bacterium]
MQRRTFMGFAGATAMATLAGCSNKTTTDNIEKTTTQNTQIFNNSLKQMRQKTKKRVVVIGGGFAGLNTASSIVSNDPKKDIEVIVIEKNQHYFVCPMSNTLLSGDSEFKKESFEFDYTNVQKEYKFEVLQAEVVGIDRKTQQVYTSSGFLEYDFLVMAPGIEYNYKAEFPHWSEAKIRQAKLEAPGGLISDGGVEHTRLIQQLNEFKKNGGDGVIAIVPPRPNLIKSLEESVPYKSLQRCKPAPYERACMIANWIKKNDLVGKAKVMILDNSARPQAKSVAFESVFKELYSDVIEYVGGFDLMDVDFDKKEITYRSINDDADYIKSTMKYDVLNLIPLQKASSLISMAGLKTNAWGGAILAKRRFYTITDDKVYVLGDSAFYGKGSFRDNPKKKAGVPAAAQTAYSSAKIAGGMIAKRLLTNVDEPIKEFSASCFSMIKSDSDRFGIAIYKDFEFTDNGFIIDESVPKIDGKYYSTMAGEGLLGWFDGITADTFATFIPTVRSLS